MKKNSNQHVLTVSCQDQQGLIYKITDVLFRHNLNIIENQEFVDRQASLFFMRTAFVGSFDSIRLMQELKDALAPQSKVEIQQSSPKRLVVFCTREPHCLGDLLLRHSTGELKAEILAVVSQYDDLKALVNRFEIPFHYIPSDKLTREQHEAKVQETLDVYHPEFLVLARYMRILTPEFVSHYQGRIINIHHSFLPAFIGEKAYVQAFERGVKIVGATAHFVTEDLDEGPIIVQGVTPVNHTQDHLSIAKAGAEIEKMVLAKAVKLVLEDRVMIYGRKTLVFD